MQESSSYFNENALFEPLWGNNRAHELNHYTDCILVSMAWGMNSSHPLRSALYAKYYLQENENVNTDLARTLTDGSQPEKEYIRYWHGSLIFLPGQSLLVNAAESYDAEEIMEFWYKSSDDDWSRYYNKILKPGDTITIPDGMPLRLFYDNYECDYTKESIKYIKDFDDIYGNDSELDDYKNYFKGWQITYIESGGEKPYFSLKPVYQYANVADVYASKTDKDVTFTAKMPELQDKLWNEWGYATPVTEQDISNNPNNDYFINPDDNKLYCFNSFQDELSDTEKELTIDLEKVKDLNIVFKSTPVANEPLISTKHTSSYRYLSTNTAVATVSKSGKIKAVGKGSCKVYAIAANGYKGYIKVTVK